MTKQDKSFTGVRIIGEKMSKHKNISSEMSQLSDSEAMREILNSNTESKSNMFLPMKNSMNMNMNGMNMNGMNINGMNGMNMNINGMMGMNQQVPNLADVDPMMINTLAPISNMDNNMMNMGQLMNSSQMAQGLGKLGQLNHTGLNIPQSFEMSEMAPPMMQHGMMQHGMMNQNMMNQNMMNQNMMNQNMMNQNMMGHGMAPPMMQQNMMGQQQMDVGMIKNLAGLNQIKMI